jgi:shikimate kinase
MGSGKTVVGALVAQRSGTAFHDLDLMVEGEAGMAVSDIFAIRSEAVFRALESRLLPKALQPETVVALGGGAAIDDSNWKVIRELATTVYLEASFETIWARIGHQANNRPLFFGHPRDEIEALMNRRRPRYEEASYRVNADLPLDQVATEVMKHWSA